MSRWDKCRACRKDFTPSEATALGMKLEGIEKEAARKRQAEAGPLEGPGKKSGGGNLPHPLDRSVGKVRDIVGRAVGLSGQTYERGRKVIEAAEKDPAKFGDLPAQMDVVAVQVIYRKRSSDRGSSEMSAGEGMIANCKGMP